MIFLTTLFPFLLKLVGDNTLGKILDYHQAQLNSANEGEKNRLQANVNLAQFELQRRQAQRDLQIAESKYESMRWPKSMIMYGVSIYWFLKLMSEALRLSDYGVVVPDLSTTSNAVSLMVLGYMFLEGPAQKALGK